jgi:hypothetical protein
MRCRFLCLGLAFTLLSVGAFAGGRFAILKAADAPRVLDQCSRGVPSGAEAYWLPTEQEITAIDALVPNALRKAGHAEAAKAFKSQPRQYVGLERGGKRFVYANVVTEQAATHMDLEAAPIIVCDGGEAFFGVEVDIERMAISHFAANGPG